MRKRSHLENIFTNIQIDICYLDKADLPLLTITFHISPVECGNICDKREKKGHIFFLFYSATGHTRKKLSFI